MPTDEKAMVAAHKLGLLVYGLQPELPTEKVHELGAGYRTEDERLAFIGGYFGAKKRAAIQIA